MKVKGFTILELIVTLGIVSIILVVETKSLFRCNNIYKNSQKELIYELNIDEAFIFMNSKINSYSYVEINNNEIIISKNIYEKEIIKKYEDKLIISYCKYFNKYNTIVNEIKEFNVYKMKNVIFVKIIGCNNKTYVRSFSLE